MNASILLRCHRGILALTTVQLIACGSFARPSGAPVDATEVDVADLDANATCDPAKPFGSPSRCEIGTRGDFDPRRRDGDFFQVGSDAS